MSRYAGRVVDGKIAAGRAVRLACERHLRDVNRQRTKGFPYWFDAKGAAQHIIDFFPEFLCLENGDPFTLIDWQVFCAGSIYGWKHQDDDRRRFLTAYIETGKGSGKSPYLAGLGLYGLRFDDENSAEIYSAAFDRGQAAIILDHAIRMARDSPDLDEALDIGKHNIADLSTRSFFRAVSSEHRSKSGPRPHYVLIDELHEHRDGVVVQKMRAGFKGRRQPLLIEITNSGHDRTSICWEHHDYSLQVLEGTVEDESWFGYVCQLDPCEACYAEGHRQPKEGCASCDDWTDPKAWPKVNPSIGVTITEDYLQRQVSQALAIPSDRALVQRLNFCIWTQSHQVWIPADEWDACRVEAVSVKNTQLRPAAAGLDLSAKLDLTAFVIALRVDDPPSDVTPEVVTIEGTDEEGEVVTQELTLNFSVEFIPFFWLPKDTLIGRVRDERIPYDVWQRGGHLHVTAGPVIDHDVIYTTITKDLAKRYRIQRLGYDPANATQMAVQLRDRAKLEVVELSQGRKLSEAFKFLEVLVRSRRARHDGHPVLAWTIGNAERKEDKYENLWIEKPSKTKRIDGAVAAAMALSQLMVLPQRRGSIYQTRGVFVAQADPEEEEAGWDQPEV